MDTIWQVIRQNREITDLMAGLRGGLNTQLLTGAMGCLQRMVLAQVRKETAKPILLIVENALQATKAFEDLGTFLPQEKLVIFPSLEVLPYEVIARSPELTTQRLMVLERLVQGESLIVIAPVQALLKKLVPPILFKEVGYTIQVRSQLDLNQLTADLINLGYERVPLVEAGGQFSLRGGIIDIYPPVLTRPIRIEMFDDEVDSIREFDPLSQRSNNRLETVVIGPAQEGVVYPVQNEEAEALIRQDLNQTLGRLTKLRKKSVKDKLKGKVEDVLRGIQQGFYFSGLDSYLPYYGHLVTLVDYFPEDSLLWVEEPMKIREAMIHWQKEVADTHLHLVKEGEKLSRQVERYLFDEEWTSVLGRRQRILASYLPQTIPDIVLDAHINLSSQPIISFYGKFELFWQEVLVWQQRRYRTVIITSTPERGQRLLDLCREKGIYPILTDNINTPISEGGLLITVGALSAGFTLPDYKLNMISDGEIFGQVKKRQPLKEKKQGTAIGRIEDLSIGDYVVHDSHGIGRYLGIETLSVNGVQKDYLQIKYANQDSLYIPTEQLNKIQKYIGGEDKSPKLSKLGGTDWSRAKKKVQQSVEELAKQLLQLYAVRETVERPGCCPDTVWQREFEDAFPFTETPDQLQAISEIKGDLEGNKPMDRLLCGDVGYGKTEVAIRAAFKVAMEGRQTAVLVPTTILAEQHGHTFRQRFADFPVTVGVLSRFRSSKEQKDIVNGLKTGAIDVVIGTHRLLQKDIKFQNLGMLIIDEEQRFGVGHKERIKQLRTHVDVLTLTATPIPRTLHMSLVGVRDMSVIETPPEDRFPVQTFVVEHSESLIRDVILREVSRGGQVYFVHNRVQTIDRMAAQLQKLVPEARFSVAHGQMSEEGLEQAMLSFLEGEQDVLVCTTIIETGLDIPNVNTLIIDNADHMGLSQLYQLRGRVGRSNRTSYAYLTYRRNKVISETAEKRLQAIKEFTDFGSGYKIAMRDLEIRGAGNLLGTEQHGHISSVGFALYCRMLEEAVSKLKGEQVQPDVDPVIELQLDAYLPATYIDNNAQKIELYKRIADVDQLTEVGEIIDEMVDRFGDLPDPAENLLKIAKLKLLAKKAGITQFSQEGDYVTVTFTQKNSLPQIDTITIMNKYRGKLSFIPGKLPICRIKTKGLDSRDCLSLLTDIVSDLTGEDQSI